MGGAEVSTVSQHLTGAQINRATDASEGAVPGVRRDAFRADSRERQGAVKRASGLVDVGEGDPHADPVTALAPVAQPVDQPEEDEEDADLPPQECRHLGDALG